MQVKLIFSRLPQVQEKRKKVENHENEFQCRGSFRNDTLRSRLGFNGFFGDSGIS
jgi:hypothetical protein